MFFVPEKYEFACDLCVKEWSRVLQSTFYTQAITKWFVLQCWRRQMLGYNSPRASDDRTCFMEGEGDVQGAWMYYHLSNNFLLFTQGTISSVLPSTKFSVVPYHIKVSGPLWWAAEETEDTSQSSFTLTLSLLPMQLQGTLFPPVPPCCSVQLPCTPCRSQSCVANLTSPWGFSANSAEAAQWKDHQFTSWSSVQDALIRRGKGCEEKIMQESRERYFSIPEPCLTVLAHWSNRQEPFKPLASSRKMGSHEFVMSGPC